MTRMSIQRHKSSRFWAVFDETGALVCVCVYKKGAEEVVRRLEDATLPDPDPFWDPRFAYLSRHPIPKPQGQRNG